MQRFLWRSASPFEGRRSVPRRLRAVGPAFALFTVSAMSLGFLMGATDCRAAGSTDVAVRARDTGPWTLDRCLDAAERTAPSLAAARARAEAAAAQSESATARLYPTIGIGGDVGYVTETMSLSLPSLLGQPAQEITFGDGWDLDVMLGVRAPLYEGGALRAERDVRRAEARASLAETAADSLDLRWQVRRAFYGALGAEAAASAARAGEARLQRHVEAIESDLAAGTASDEMRIQALARLRRTEQTTVEAAAEAAVARLALGRLVGRPGVEIVPDADLSAALLVGDEIGRPWDERPELRALDARLAAAAHGVRAGRSSLRPALELQGGWHYGRPGIDAVTNEWMGYGTVALGLSWPLFDFGATHARVSGLRAQARALGAVRDDTDQALQTRLATARARHDAAIRALDRARERVELEHRRLDLVEARRGAGHATESDWLDAQDDATLAEMDLALTRARLRTAEADLIAALGR